MPLMVRHGLAEVVADVLDECIHIDAKQAEGTMMAQNQKHDVIDVQAREFANDPQQLMQLKQLGWVSYGMHLVVAVCAVIPGLEPSMLLLLLALILDLVKRSDAVGTWQESHFKWRIASVGWACFWYVITLPLYFPLYFPGKLAWFVVSVWFLIRIVRGMVAMNQEKQIGV